MPDFPQRWGAYVLIRPLGSGGMGTVFLALTRAGEEETVCVIKRLTAETLSDAGRRRRFQREGEISRTLSFEGIAKTLECGEQQGEPYIAQEYIEGRTAAQLCAAAGGVGERLSPLMVAQIGQRVASALAYAHRRDVVHRDIAPSNVMISFAGAVSLIDFGIARRSGDPSLTATGDFIGRAVYTAPEVLKRGEADPRTDIYSLGVLLWELLVGRLPALGELESHPDPSSLATGEVIPADLDKLIVRALDPDPARRFSSAEDFATGLLHVAPGGLGRSAELATLIGRCYEVTREHERLQADVDEARPLLATGALDGRQAAAKGARSSALRWSLLLGAGAAVAAAAAIGLCGRRSESGFVVPVASPSPAAPPAAPLPRSTALPGPAPMGRSERREPIAKGTPAAERLSHAKVASTAARVSAPTSHPAAPDPGQAGRLLDRARDSLQDGDLESAALNARKAVETGTARQRSAAHLIMGRVLLLEGQRNQAADEFVEAIRLDPENTTASDHLAGLRRKGVE